MKSSKLMVVLFAAAGLYAAGGAQAATGSRDARNASIKQAEMTYKSDKDACKSLSGNANDICMAEAKGKEKVAKAEADAAYESTPKARESARKAKADADYDVAKEKCDDLSGNAKDVCVKEAKAAHVKSLADAKVDRVASDTRNESMQKTAAAKQDAAQDKRDADYKVAIEKCDALAGPAKDACVHDAKMRFGKG
jgi:hypothetical protein